MGVGYSNCKVTGYGGPLEYRTFWTIIRLFSVQFSDHYLNKGPIDNRPQIYHSITRLVRYSNTYCNCDNFCRDFEWAKSARLNETTWSIASRSGCTSPSSETPSRKSTLTRGVIIGKFFNLWNTGLETGFIPPSPSKPEMRVFGKLVLFYLGNSHLTTQWVYLCNSLMV